MYMKLTCYGNITILLVFYILKLHIGDNSNDSDINIISPQHQTPHNILTYIYDYRDI